MNFIVRLAGDWSEYMDYSKEVSCALNYIEQNLEDDLSLKSISQISFLSQYHYHRIFLANMGTSIMNYIRTRRVVRASYQLILSDSTITDVAFNSGFECIDTFTRVFKRFYGITPSEYRTIQLKNNSYIQQEVLLMSEKQIFSKLENCTLEEKRECWNVLERIIDLSKKAHKHGLLSLESELNIEQSLFLNKGLELLLAGIKPNHLKEILWNYVKVGNYTSKEVLERMIVLHGILLIQTGEYPWIIREQLSSFFGEYFIGEIDDWYGINKNRNNRILEFKDKIVGKKPFSDETSILEKEIKNMDVRSIQRLVRELDIIILAFAIEGASGEVKLKLMNGLSKQNQQILLETLELLSDISIAQIVDSQKEVLKIIKALRLSKDIK